VKLLVLDDAEEARSVDADDMLDAVEHFPDQCQEAVYLAEKVELDDLKRVAEKASSVLILGMGGSGVGGDLTRTLLEGSIKVPIETNKGYDLPSYAGEDTLVFAVSYSGNTEETLSGFDQAVQRKCGIISITTGGELAKKCKDLGSPVLKIPSGIQPRAALGYLFLPILVILQRLGLVASLEEDIEETLQLLRSQTKVWGFYNPIEENPAKALAARLYQTLPVIYGSKGLSDSVALRWKCQFNENTKLPAIWNVFPELNHNETVSWDLLEELTENFALIILRDTNEPGPIRKRIEITTELVQDNFGSVEMVWAEGKSALAKMLYLINFGDYVSVYLALLYQVDPSPVERIRILKERLAGE
jgi:glucose/mannose-6-phosphate isomerase